jgi:hypothetical protein
MPKHFPQQAKTPIQSPGDRLIDTVTLNQQEAIDGVEAAGHALACGLEAAQREIADFVSERIRQDLDTQHALLLCRTLHEVQQVQFDFLRRAVGQYGGEATRLLQIGGRIAARSLDRA